MDIDKTITINIKIGQVLNRIVVEDAIFMNDIATDALAKYFSY